MDHSEYRDLSHSENRTISPSSPMEMNNNQQAPCIPPNDGVHLPFDLNIEETQRHAQLIAPVTTIASQPRHHSHQRHARTNRTSKKTCRYHQRIYRPVLDKVMPQVSSTSYDPTTSQIIRHHEDDSVSDFPILPAHLNCTEPNHKVTSVTSKVPLEPSLEDLSIELLVPENVTDQSIGNTSILTDDNSSSDTSSTLSTAISLMPNSSSIMPSLDVIDMIMMAQSSITSHSPCNPTLEGLSDMENPDRELNSMITLCDQLSMMNEENLDGFKLNEFMPHLIRFLGPGQTPMHVLYACRVLSYLLDILPAMDFTCLRYNVIPSLCNQLLNLAYDDLHDEVSNVIGRLCERPVVATGVLKYSGLELILKNLDFYPISVQRQSLNTASNMLACIPTDCWPQILVALPTLISLLEYEDAKLVEKTCLCLTLITQAFSAQPPKIKILFEHGIAKQLVKQLANQGIVKTIIAEQQRYAMSKIDPTLNDHYSPSKYKKDSSQTNWMSINLAIECLKTLYSASPDNFWLEQGDLLAIIRALLYHELDPANRIIHEQRTDHHHENIPPIVRHGSSRLVTNFQSDQYVYNLLTIIDLLLAPLPPNFSILFKLPTSKSNMTYSFTNFSSQLMSNSSFASFLLDHNKLQPEQYLEAMMAKPYFSNDETSEDSQLPYHRPSSLDIDQRHEVITQFLPLLMFNFLASLPLQLKALSLISKMICLVSADVLETCLDEWQISSFIVQLFANKELPVLAVALRLATILIQTLPLKCEKSFQREGLFHELNALLENIRRKRVLTQQQLMAEISDPRQDTEQRNQCLKTPIDTSSNSQSIQNLPHSNTKSNLVDQQEDDSMIKQDVPLIEKSAKTSRNNKTSNFTSHITQVPFFNHQGKESMTISSRPPIFKNNAMMSHQLLRSDILKSRITYLSMLFIESKCEEFLNTFSSKNSSRPKQAIEQLTYMISRLYESVSVVDKKDIDKSEGNLFCQFQFQDEFESSHPELVTTLEMIAQALENGISTFEFSKSGICPALLDYFLHSFLVDSNNKVSSTIINQVLLAKLRLFCKIFCRLSAQSSPLGISTQNQHSSTPLSSLLAKLQLLLDKFDIFSTVRHVDLNYRPLTSSIRYLNSTIKLKIVAHEDQSDHFRIDYPITLAVEPMTPISVIQKRIIKTLQRHLAQKQKKLGVTQKPMIPHSHSSTIKVKRASDDLSTIEPLLFSNTSSISSRNHYINETRQKELDNPSSSPNSHEINNTSSTYDILHQADEFTLSNASCLDSSYPFSHDMTNSPDTSGPLPISSASHDVIEYNNDRHPPQIISSRNSTDQSALHVPNEQSYASQSTDHEDYFHKKTSMNNDFDFKEICLLLNDLELDPTNNIIQTLYLHEYPTLAPVSQVSSLLDWNWLSNLSKHGENTHSGEFREETNELLIQPCRIWDQVHVLKYLCKKKHQTDLQKGEISSPSSSSSLSSSSANSSQYDDNDSVVNEQNQTYSDLVDVTKTQSCLESDQGASSCPSLILLDFFNSTPFDDMFQSLSTHFYTDRLGPHCTLQIDHVISLLRILFDLNLNLSYLLSPIVACAHLTHLPSAHTLFINAKIANKLDIQLQDSLLVIFGLLPQWSTVLTCDFKFLFPYLLRHRYFRLTSFGVLRTLNILEGGNTGTNTSPLSEILCQKVEVQRDSLMDDAILILRKLHGCQSYLRITYKGEVGTGLGPTLEFFTLISREFQRLDLNMWVAENQPVQKQLHLKDKAYSIKGKSDYNMTYPPSFTRHKVHLLDKRIKQDTRSKDRPMRPSDYALHKKNMLFSTRHSAYPITYSKQHLYASRLSSNNIHITKSTLDEKKSNSGRTEPLPLPASLNADPIFHGLKSSPSLSCINNDKEHIYQSRWRKMPSTDPHPLFNHYREHDLDASTLFTLSKSCRSRIRSSSYLNKEMVNQVTTSKMISEILPSTISISPDDGENKAQPLALDPSFNPNSQSSHLSKTIPIQFKSRKNHKLGLNSLSLSSRIKNDDSFQINCDPNGQQRLDHLQDDNLDQRDQVPYHHQSKGEHVDPSKPLFDESPSYFDARLPSSSSQRFAFHSGGLFPQPFLPLSSMEGTIAPANVVDEAQISPTTSKEQVLNYFENLGTFFAKVLLDGPLVDFPFSTVFYKKLVHQPLSIDDFQPIYPVLISTLRELRVLLDQRQHWLSNHVEKSILLSSSKNPNPFACPPLSNDQIKCIQSQVLFHGDIQLDDLWLDFTLPGFGQLQPNANGSHDIPSLTLFNLHQYLELMIDAIAFDGISSQFQAFERGFCKVFSSHRLQLFYPHELAYCLVGSSASNDDDQHHWDIQHISENTKCDHGFTTASPLIGWIHEVINEFVPEERRQFLHFITGSPRLPLQGFKGYYPKLTFVRKDPQVNHAPDEYLPSVNTCFLYLSLPDYSSKAMLKQRLIQAMTNGQYGFSLS